MDKLLGHKIYHLHLEFHNHHMEYKFHQLLCILLMNRREIHKFSDLQMFFNSLDRPCMTHLLTLVACQYIWAFHSFLSLLLVTNILGIFRTNHHG